MTSDPQIPEVHEGQGVLYNADNSINLEALPDNATLTLNPEGETSDRDLTPGEEWAEASQEDKAAANKALFDIHNSAKTSQNNPDLTQQIPLPETTTEDKPTTLDGEMTPNDRLEMCEMAASSYFGVTARAFAENFDYWISEYEKESSDRSYKNKIWLVTKLINGDPALRATVVNQAKLAEIAGRL